jgi:AcrR family transcriptional regulator
MKAKDVDTRERILTAGGALMWKYGIRRITVGEICREAGVSKMTFYKYFENKIAVAKAALQRSADELWGKVEELMARPISFKEKAELFIRLKIEQTDAWSQEITRELFEESVPGMAEFVTGLRQGILDKTIAMFRHFQETGDIRRDIKPEFLLNMLNRLTDTLKDRDLAALYPSFHALVKEIMEFLFYGMLSNVRGCV